MKNNYIISSIAQYSQSLPSTPSSAEPGSTDRTHHESLPLQHFPVLAVQHTFNPPALCLPTHAQYEAVLWSGCHMSLQDNIKPYCG